MIYNKVNEYRYIGQSKRKNINDRFEEHKFALNNNIHGNSYLQDDWNKYGEKSFEFKLIQKISYKYKDKLNYKINEAEKFFIEYFDCMYYRYGYNITPGGYYVFKNKKEKIILPSKRSPKYFGKLSQDKNKLIKAYIDIHVGVNNAKIRKKYDISKHNLYSLRNKEGTAWEIIKNSILEVDKCYKDYFEIYDEMKLVKGFKNIELSVIEIVDLFKDSINLAKQEIFNKYHVTNYQYNLIKQCKKQYGLVITKYFEKTNDYTNFNEFMRFRLNFSENLKNKIAILSNDHLKNLNEIVEIKNKLDRGITDDILLIEYNLNFSTLDKIKNNIGIYKFIFDEYKEYLKL